MKKYYQKEKLTFGRKERKDEFLIYNARNRTIHLMPKEIYKVWKCCDNNSLEDIFKSTKIPKKKLMGILKLLKDKKLIKEIKKYAEPKVSSSH
jgi:hypothetical protein